VRPGPDFRTLLRKRLTVRGFIVTDFAAKAADFRRDMALWLADGHITYREDVVEGLEKAPAAFIGLLQGKNFGKLLVKIA
jgi:NADPH-dependent curcumin reductase CurA